MFHKNRQHNVTNSIIHKTIDSFISHFEKCSTWCCCTAFIIDPGYEGKSELVKPALLIANDSTSADGGQEYATFFHKDGKWVMFESFSIYAQNMENFRQFLTNSLTNLLEKGVPNESLEPFYISFVHNRVTFDEDHRCRHCA